MMSNVQNFIEKAIAGRWISGSTIQDAITDSKEFNSKGIKTIINYLGESFTNDYEIAEAVDTYMRLIRYIAENGINADISVKPTQLGLLKDADTLKSNYSKIVAEARKAKIFVWLDMEEADYVDATIQLYLSELDGAGVGICMQSYLKRSEDDIRKILQKGSVIRLVKGAYSSTKNKSFNTREAVTSNYSKLMGMLFSQGAGFTLGTHDIKMIKEAQALNKEYRRDVTYAMLKGINNKYLLGLSKSGNKVAVYLPFGKRWLAYSYRRLKEAGHIKLILKSLMKSQKLE